MSRIRVFEEAYGRYYTEIRHDGLKEYRVIRGKVPHEVEEKAGAQLAKWDETWRKRVAAEESRAAKEDTVAEREHKKQLAAERTAEAQQSVQALQGLLTSALPRDATVDWETLKDRSAFEKPRPQLTAPPPPQAPKIPPAPYRSHAKYQPVLGLLDSVLPKRRQAKTEAASKLFAEDCRAWQEQKQRLDSEAASQRKQYEEQLSRMRQRVAQAQAQWEADRIAFLRHQAEANADVDRAHADYLKGDPDSVRLYCGLVLMESEYPTCLPTPKRELGYVPSTRTVVVECTLPSPEDLPKTKEVKYIQSRDEFQEVLFPVSFSNELYDTVAYSICLRVIYELYQSDVSSAIDSVVFNGWVHFVDKGDGKDVNACILSLQASREEFLAVNLGQVDPKTCFRKLKGVGSARLHGLAPIAPICQISREDSRFVNSREVAAELDQGVNLAALDWEDFEHLVRELFEQEFGQYGGEVKVTQASRDGGVDAVAFDPDPIRGGKIVIQAKRYTNTVGVSAVRDLFGTVNHEGAMKGILITTSDYGPDAYEFAKGKPLTLLNGGNLLHLLQKHGHKARIDLREARQAEISRS